MTDDQSSRGGISLAIGISSAKLELHGVPKVPCADANRGIRERRTSWHNEEKSSSAQITACRVVEVLVLCAIVLGLSVLYMIPTIYFVNPPVKFQPVCESKSVELSQTVVNACRICFQRIDYTLVSVILASYIT